MDPKTELLLYIASRRQHLVEKVLLLLKLASWSLWTVSSIVPLLIRDLVVAWILMPLIGSITLVQMASKPDLTLYFDIEVEEGLARIAANSDREVNRLDLEGLTCTRKFVKVIFLFWTKEGNRIVKIYASLPLEQVVETTKAVLFDRMGLAK